MKVIVTGREGQVAQCLASNAAAQKFDLQFVARPEFDLSDTGTVRHALDSLKPDVIVNAAAYTAVDLAEDQPDVAYAVNAGGPAAIAEWCAKNDARMLHLSTDYVFAGTGNRAHVETDPVGPQGVYGQTKLAGEIAIREALDAHLIMRTAWVYSPFGKNFVKTMLKLAETRPELSVVADQFGNPTSANDISAAVFCILQNWQSGGNTGIGQTYHVAGTGDASWADLAECVFAESTKMGGPFAAIYRIASKQYPTKAKRPANSRLDTTKFERDFGWRAPEWRISAQSTVRTLLAAS